MDTFEMSSLLYGSVFTALKVHFWFVTSRRLSFWKHLSLDGTELSDFSPSEMFLFTKLDDFSSGAQLPKSISNTHLISPGVIRSRSRAIISTLITAHADGYLRAFLIGRLVFLNAYLCRPPWGRLSPEPPLNRAVESENQTHRSDMLAFGGEGKWWRGWLEWIMYIITCLSPEHLAKSLKHCSNHNNQSSCCFSSTVCILNLHEVNLRVRTWTFLRAEQQ